MPTSTSQRSRRPAFVGVGLFVAASLAGILFFGRTGLGARDASPTTTPRPADARFAKTIHANEFQKGSIHAHSNLSDGDSPPEAVYLWYRDNGYNFVALTDHSRRVDPASYARLERPDFRLVSGEEVTMGGNNKQVHVNALCIGEAISGGSFATARLALDHAVSEIDKQGGVALINHPNFDFGLTADDVAGTRGAALLEVWSGHPYVWTLGKDGRPSHEAIWEHALDSGLDLAPAGVDDMHQLLENKTDRKPARPGRAWVQVFADSADPTLLCDRMRSGDLYATNGAELSRIAVDERSFTVWPDATKATVEFIGQGGALLAKAEASRNEPAVYALKGTETYVRARITDSHGKLAFTPAYRVVVGEP